MIKGAKYSELGWFIKHFRITNYKTPISASEFALRCGLSKTLIYNLENGNYNSKLSLDNLEKIAIEMNLSCENLISRFKNDQHPENLDNTKINQIDDLFNTTLYLNDANLNILHNYYKILLESQMKNNIN